MRVVQRADERLLLVIAAVLADGAFLDEFPVKFVAIFKAVRAHALGRADAFGGLLRIGDEERAVFAAEKTGGVKGLEFLAFAEIETLADVNERGHGGVHRPERAGDDGADVRRGDGLRRRVAGVPLVLMARMQNEAEVARRVGADQRGAVHDLRDLFQALREFDVVHGGVDRRERGQDLVGRQAGFVRRVALGIERLGVRHAAGHPEDDDGVGGGFDFFLLRRRGCARG